MIRMRVESRFRPYSLRLRSSLLSSFPLWNRNCIVAGVPNRRWMRCLSSPTVRSVEVNWSSNWFTTLNGISAKLGFRRREDERNVNWEEAIQISFSNRLRVRERVRDFNGNFESQFTFYEFKRFPPNFWNHLPRTTSFFERVTPSLSCDQRPNILFKGPCP